MKSSPRIVPSVALLAIASMGAAASTAGWDLTKPLSFYFPPPLADVPKTAEAGDPGLKSAGPTLEDQVMELVNQERWNNGQLPPLKRDSLLDTSADTHGNNMATRNFFSHRDLDDGCSWPWDRILAAGYDWNYAGENLAAGSSTAAGAMSQWMGSPSHREQILSTTSREIGISYVYDPSDSANVRYDTDSDCVANYFNQGPWYHYWTQNFGMRNTVYPVVINREAYATATRDVSLYLYGSGWATEMRIRNEGGTWTAWQSFSAGVAWQLSAGAGTKEVFVEIRQGGTVRSASDTIISTVSSDPNLIFEDDFELSTTDAWSSTVP